MYIYVSIYIYRYIHVFFFICVPYMAESHRKVSLIETTTPLIAAASAASGCQFPNQYGWPLPYGCLVVDLLNVHVKIEPPLACSGPPQADPPGWPLCLVAIGLCASGPGPPLAGPSLRAASTDSKPVGPVRRHCWWTPLSLRAIGTSPQIFHGRGQDWHPDHRDSDCHISCPLTCTCPRDPCVA